MATYRLSIDKGATFDFIFVRRLKSGTLLDLSGLDHWMEIRPSTGGEPIILNEANNHATVDYVASRVVFSLSPEETAAIAWQKGNYAVFVDYPNGKRKRLLKGEISRG